MSDHRRKAPLELYRRLLEDRTQLRRVLVAEARCDAGCLLLHVFNTPAGLAWGRTPRRQVTEPPVDPSDPTRTLPSPRVEHPLAAGWVEGEDSVPSGCRHIDYVPVQLRELTHGEPGRAKVHVYRRV